MTEFSMPWSGSSLGDCGPYTDDQWTDMQRKIFQNDRRKDGVILGYGNNLEVINSTLTTMIVKSGAALVDGKFYENTGNVSLPIVFHVGDFYAIGLSKDFLTQEVRAFITGPSIVDGLPITQTDGVKWEIKLAEIEMVAGPKIYVYDYRKYISFTSPVIHRQGYSSTNWYSAGAGAIVYNWSPVNSNIQCGEIHVPFIASDLEKISVVFPKPYHYNPIVLATISNFEDCICFVEVTSLYGVDISVKSLIGNITDTVTVFWMSLGREWSY